MCLGKGKWRVKELTENLGEAVSIVEVDRHDPLQNIINALLPGIVEPHMVRPPSASHQSLESRSWDSRAERRAARTGETASETDETILSWPHDASSAPWSSRPSLQRSYQLGRVTDWASDVGGVGIVATGDAG